MVDLEAVEILLVEDNPADAELTLRASRAQLGNRAFWVKDGAEALTSFLQRPVLRPPYRQRPRLVLLDIVAEGGWHRSAEKIKADERTAPSSGDLTSSQEEPIETHQPG